MYARGEGDRRGRGRVPRVLASRVDEDVRLARALLGEPPDDQLVRTPVAFGGVGVRANREQERSGLRRDARGKTIFVR